MPQITRMYCAGCGESVYNCEIDGQRIPLVFYFVVGQGPDTGPSIDVNAPGLAVPSFVRELMQTPVGRVELCVRCAADVFGVKLVSAQDDPMYDANNDKIPDALQLNDPAMSEVEKAQLRYRRVLHAIKVGQGRASVDELPPEFRPPVAATA